MTASDQASRDKASEVLKRIGPAAIPELSEAVVAKNSRIRTSAWNAIPKVPLLVRRIIVRTIKPPDSSLLRIGAARALRLYGPEAREAIPELEIALHDPRRDVAVEVSDALASIGEASVPVFDRGLTNGDPWIRRTAAYSLRNAGPGAAASMGSLIRALDDPDDNVRAAAAYTIAKVQVHVISNLAVVAQSGSGNSREAAAKGLLAVQQAIQRSLPALVRMAKDTDPMLRREAIENLRALGIQTPPLRMYMDALEDPVAEVRLAATDALASLGRRARPSAQSLVRRLGDDTPQVRAAAARALAALEAAVPEAMPVLQKLLEDKDPSVQAAAREALTKLGTSPTR